MFNFISGHTYLYKMGALAKFLLLLAVEIAVFLTPYYISIAAIAIGFLIAITSRLPFSAFLKDLKGAGLYSLFIIVVDVLSYLISVHTLYDYCLTRSSVLLILRLCVLVLYTSLFFRSTSSLEILESLEKCENFFTHGKTRFILSKTIATFLSFIPLLFSIYDTVKLAYSSRTKKKSPFAIIRIFPTFITASVQKAATKELVLKSREP